MTYSTHPQISALRASGLFSDMEIRCGNTSFRVHRAIVCPQSKFFMKAFQGPFKEEKFGVIEIHDDDPEIVARMIAYFYDFDYGDSAKNKDEMCKESHPDEPDLFKAQLVNVAVYALAEKYTAPELKDLAIKKFNAKVSMVTQWIHGLPEILHAIYTATTHQDNELRDIIVSIFVDHAIRQRDSAGDCYEVLKHLQEANIDILEAMLVKIDEITTGSSKRLEKAEKALEEATSKRKQLECENVRLKNDLDTTRNRTKNGAVNPGLLPLAKQRG